ncbi:cadherin-like beta sandwich domain-containing protein [Paenibacillus sp. P36]|uniref:cadherin-like beta sandwich domain-containing protein n=1 Tax=Paenibacillus sp. P36 TaxID=3342538 RepID=UPI0038B348CC
MNNVNTMKRVAAMLMSFMLLVLPVMQIVLGGGVAYATPETKVWTDITKSGGFWNPYGVALGGDGTLYVTDRDSNKIKKMPSGGNAWQDITSAGGFDNPNGIAVDSNGTVYVSDGRNKKIKKLSSGGSTWQDIPNEQQYEFNIPTGIAVGSDGTVYVADPGYNQIKKRTSGGSAWEDVTYLGSPVGIAIGSDGTLYVTDRYYHQIRKLTSGSSTWEDITHSGGFDNPDGIAVGSDGTIYVSDGTTGQIKKLPSGASVWEDITGSGAFNTPAGLAAGSDGTLYVVDSRNYKIKKWSSGYLVSFDSRGGTSINAQPVAKDGYATEPAASKAYSTLEGWYSDSALTQPFNFATTAITVNITLYAKWDTSIWVDITKSGDFNNPSGVAVGSDGTVYVTDRNNHKIKKLSSTGSTSAWEDITNLQMFYSPSGIAVGSDGTVYVADAGIGQIKKLPSGASAWEDITLSGGFNFPGGIAVDRYGALYVADTMHNQIKKLPSGGSTWADITYAGDFQYPAGVAVDNDGTVYVADTYHSKIKKLPDGASDWEDITKSGTFSFPTGIAAGSNGAVYVVDSEDNRQVKKLSSGGNSWKDITNSGGFYYPNGIAVGSDGSLYVPDTSNFIRKQSHAYTVNFVTNDAWWTAGDQIVIHNDHATEPTVPTRTGYLFEGWYSSSQFSGAPFDVATTTITSDHVLYAKWVMTAATVNIEAPVLDATPQDVAAIEEATANVDYTVTHVTWNEPLTTDGKFKRGQSYTATVELTSKNAKEFQAVAFTPTVDEASEVGSTVTTGTGVGNTVTFTVAFPATEIPIGTAAIAGITPPVTGAVPVSTIPATSEYTATVEWSPSDAVFAPNTSYTASITITPNEGYTLIGTDDNFFTVAGATSVTTDVDTGVVTAVFPATAPLNNNALLANLTVDQGALTFSSLQGTYSVDVPSAITSLHVAATKAEVSQSLAVTGAVYTTATGNVYTYQASNLTVGANAIRIVVTSEDQTQNTYNLTVNRLSNNAELSGLALSGIGLTPAFDSGTTTYTANVVNEVSSTTVTPTVLESQGRVTVNGTSVTSGGTSDVIPLIVGSNTITLVVTAQDGTTKTYTFTITRAKSLSNNADLSGLTLSGVNLMPAFASGTTAYTANVANEVSSTAVTPTVSESQARVAVNGTSVTSGGTSDVIPLIVGSNTITLVVTAQDGTTKTYTVTITRANAGGGSGPSGGSGGSGGSGSSGSASTGAYTDGKLTLPAGDKGEVSLNQEVTVSIPAGATNRELNVTITKVLEAQALLTNQKALASPVFEIVKNFSENFIKPITLTFVFDKSKLSGDQTVSVFYFDETKKEWVKVPGGKINEGKITVEVNHFTKYAVFAVGQGATVPPTDIIPSIHFSDISGHWAEVSIKQAVNLGIVNGYPDGTFKPNKTVTRAEFAVMLMNTLKPQGNGAELTFTDKGKIGTWAQKSVAQAVQAGIITGYEDSTFRSDAEISRSEMAVMIAKALGQSVEAATATGFADDKDIPDWAKGAVGAMKKLSMIEGKGSNTFAPGDKTTRAESVTVLLKVLAQKGR